MNNIYERLKEVFRTIYDIDIDKMETASLDKDLLGRDWGFLPRDLFSLFFIVEKEFAIVIPEEEIAAGRFNTFNNISEIINKQLPK